MSIAQPDARQFLLRHPADDDQTGRGLLLVEAVASLWGTGERPFGKYVWFELDLKRGGAHHEDPGSATR